MNNTWNQEEFLAFTLIYAAHADMEFSDEEKSKIKQIVNEKTFSNLYSIFNDMSDYKSLETILSYKGLHYPTAARKSELLNQLKSLFEADGDYSRIEQGLFQFLDKLM